MIEKSERPHRRRLDAGEIRNIAQRLTQIVDAAFTEIAVEARELLGRERGDGGEPWIGTVVAGKGREHHAVVARDVADAFEPIAPIIHATEAAHDHQLGVRHHALDIEVDRHRMF